MRPSQPPQPHSSSPQNPNPPLYPCTYLPLPHIRKSLRKSHSLSGAAPVILRRPRAWSLPLAALRPSHRPPIDPPPPPTFADIMFRTLLLLAFAVWCAAAARRRPAWSCGPPFCALRAGLAAPRLAAHSPPASPAARAACGRPAPREQGAGVARCGYAGARKGVAKKAVVKKSSSTEGKGGIFPWITNKPGSACRATRLLAAAAASRRRRRRRRRRPRPAAARPPPLTRALRRPRSQRTRSR